MSTPMQKSLSSHKRVRIAGVIIYLVATFVVPLTHTCPSRWANLAFCEFHGAHQHPSGGPSAADPTDGMPQQGDHERTHSDYGYVCTACVHSYCCRSTEVRHGNGLIVPKIPVFAESVPTSHIVTRLQWSSSILLRAPPVFTS
jgi:hypothetical protein